MTTKDKPEIQSFQIQGVKHISPDEAFQLLLGNEAILIDVREEFEIKGETVGLENVEYIPMSGIMDKIASVSKDQNIIIGCPEGVRSTKVANLFNFQGYESVANLDGGFTAWQEEGLPYTKPQKDHSCHGCGCGC